MEKTYTISHLRALTYYRHGTFSGFSDLLSCLRVLGCDPGKACRFCGASELVRLIAALEVGLAKAVEQGAFFFPWIIVGIGIILGEDLQGSEHLHSPQGSGR